MSDQLSDPLLNEKIAKSTEAIEKLISVMPIDSILKLREDLLKVHNQQMRMVDKILAERGYVNGGIQG